MNKLYSLSTIALLIAILTYAVIEWRNSKQSDEVSVVQGVTPDFIAEQLNTNIYNKSGALSQQVTAQRMEHFADLGITQFEYPQFTLYPKNHTLPWQMSSSEGTLSHNNRLTLENRVKLIATDKESLVQEIQGKTLEIDLNTNILSSAQTILIQGKDFTMYGSGLIVDLNTTQMTLTEHVQTIYKKINR